jgi:hypothetical protein
MTLGLAIYLFWAEIGCDQGIYRDDKNYDLYNGYKVF